MARSHASRIPLAIVGVLAVAAACLAAWLAFGGGSPVTDGIYQEARIVRVVDGDTLVVNVNGEDARLRLIGIDAPESVSSDPDANTPEGEAAHWFLEQNATTGQIVYLQKDISEVDRYGRLLRYVWIERPSDPITLDDVRDKMLNGIVVANGFAQAKRYPPDTAFARQFEALQAEAAADDLGISYLWSE